MASARKSIWLDVDTGHDDVFALLLAAFDPGSRLVGISTSYGNAAIKHTTNNTQAVLQALGRAEIPLIQGSAKPLQREPSYATSIHGATGLDGVSLLPSVPLPGAHPPAPPPYMHTARLAEALLGHAPRTVWFVATGPLTNLARVLQDFPAVGAHLAGASIMGGAVGAGYTGAPLGRVRGDRVARIGNWTPYAEFNIYNDPDAANIVFGNAGLAGRINLAPLDLTHQCRADAAVQKALFGLALGERQPGGADTEPQQAQLGKLTRTRRMLREVLLYFAEAYHRTFSIADGPPLHDPLAVYMVLHPELFGDQTAGEAGRQPRPDRWHVSALSDSGSERHGQIVLSDGRGEPAYRGPAAAESAGGAELAARAAGDGALDAAVWIPRALDLPRFWADIEAAIQAAEKHVAAHETEQARRPS